MYRLVFIICINAVLGKVLTTQGYPVQQYIHVTGVPSYRSDPPTRSSNQPPSAPPTISKAKSDSLPISAPSASSTTTSTSLSKKDTPTLDSNVLNNLAIALQLLIVSNILNLPPQEANSEIASKMALALDQPIETPYPSSYIIEPPKYEMGPKYAVESMISSYMEPVSIPNVGIIGSSGFGETNIYGPFTPTGKPSPRSEMGFMSPYDALSANSPYSDPILSSKYGSVPSKRDFQSPYAAILSDNKDLFPFLDFF